MWFKQLQLFQLNSSFRYSAEELAEKLQPLAFTPCLPSMPYSLGWISPVEENDSLVRHLNGYMMICLQVEEKILPGAVIRQEVAEAIRQIETSENRKLRQKEKYSLKDDITTTLLPRAFSRFTKFYAFFDYKNQWLILGTTNTKKTEQFISLLKKSFDEEMTALDTQQLSSTLTQWLKTQHYPTDFSIEKACVLQDPKQENRIIRCKQQDLFASGIQSLLDDGCEVMQLALCWQDRVNFSLAKHFLISNIQFQDEFIEQVKSMEPETLQQQWDADFVIMTDTLAALLTDLLNAISAQKLTAQVAA